MPVRRVTHGSAVDALDSLVRSLAAFEQKYGMPSVELYSRYLSGTLEDSLDYVEWAGDYQHYKVGL